MSWVTVWWWVARSYWDDALVYIARWWAKRRDR
jgi:hypothetical protein